MFFGSLSLLHYILLTMRLVTAIVSLVLLSLQGSSALSPSCLVSRRSPSRLFSSTVSDDFTSFENSLADDDESTASSSKKRTWQDDLDDLMDPTTDMARRQILLSDLLNANAEIQQAVQAALRERKIDSLLTPRGRRLQDGTKAVARQLTTDILPTIASQARPGQSSSTSSFPFPFFPNPEDLNKVGNRIFNAVSNQVQKNIETFQSDLADPRRIPQRLSQQTEELVKEASNIFAETPTGLKEPPYTIVKQTENYEIRDYAGYSVASTNMAPAGEIYNMDDLAQSGSGFNTLAAYLFGANRNSKAMDMTTPVTTTMSGEMRFYLAEDIIPDPLEQDESKSVYETGNILIQEIPPARLAVRRFTGFVTSGEVHRQKEALLAALELDGVELDVDHGQTVGHVVFQYNPPYTLPVVRRNEIAVPVVDENTVVAPVKRAWESEEDDSAWESAPSD